jgi:ABC-type polysaccharide/polyol phosphate transport system ATPase subunit
MAEESAVSVHDLGKCYRVYGTPMQRLVEWASFGRLVRHAEKWALRGVSFEVPRGSALGIVGANGAGKSTLLKVLTGTTPPTTGTYRITGRVGSLLELGAGFHPEFSGRDNVFMNAAIMGIPKREVRSRLPELAEFADLGPYLDRQVRTYSTGMSMRLAFAVAILADPEVLILDEVLAVGDQAFQRKCMDRIRDIRRSGATVLFVSHSVSHIRQICDQAIWINEGAVVTRGHPPHVTDEYVNFQFAEAGGKAAQLRQVGISAPAGLPHLGEIKMCREGQGRPAGRFSPGDVVDIHLQCVNPTGEGRFHVGILVSRDDDVQVFGSRSREFDRHLDGKDSTLVLRVPLDMNAGKYFISGYLLDETCDQILDQRLAWARFEVVDRKPGRPTRGVIRLDCHWLAPQEAH